MVLFTIQCPRHYTGVLGPTQSTGWAPPAGLTDTSSNRNLVFPGVSIQVLTRSTLLIFSVTGLGLQGDVAAKNKLEKVHLLFSPKIAPKYVFSLVCKRFLICADFSPDSDQTTFPLEETLLEIMDFFFNQKQWFWVKMSYKHILSSQDVIWWTGVVWIIVMFLSAVWTLILTAPIHCRGSIDEQMIEWHISPNLMKKQTKLNLGQ